MKKKKKKKEDKKLCVTKGQLKTLLDEARGGEVCEAAADLIKEIDEEFEIPKEIPLKKKKKKQQKTFIERWL